MPDPKNNTLDILALARLYFPVLYKSSYLSLGAENTLTCVDEGAGGSIYIDGRDTT